MTSTALRYRERAEQPRSQVFGIVGEESTQTLMADDFTLSLRRRLRVQSEH